MKQDDTKVEFEDGNEIDKAYGYFVLSTAWMSKWRKFLNSGGKYPGPIDNKDLTSLIKSERKRLGNPPGDNDLDL